MGRLFFGYVKVAFLLVSFGWSGSAFGKDQITVTLDWVPSAEHYGFYYARDNHIYDRHDLDVTIRNASGAPVVATQLAAGRIKVGTTSSDNILLQVAKGARFSQIVPITRYNPVSLVSSAKRPIRSPKDIDNVVIGTNPQASPYAQFNALVKANNIAKGRYREYPIGYGGAVQLIAGEVNGFLAYTTNQAIDLKVANEPIVEMMLQDWDITAYGFVLVVAQTDQKDAAAMARFVKATIEGYRRGAEDIEGAAAGMTRVEPTLKREKVAASIERMASLNRGSSKEVPKSLDAWVSLPGVDLASFRTMLRAEYESGLRAWE